MNIILRISAAVFLCVPLTHAASADDAIKQYASYCPIAKAFTTYDADNDGNISVAELSTCYASERKDKENVKKYIKSATSMIKAIDKDGNKLVSKSEYLALLKGMSGEKKNSGNKKPETENGKS